MAARALLRHRGYGLPGRARQRHAGVERALPQSLLSSPGLSRGSIRPAAVLPSGGGVGARGREMSLVSSARPRQMHRRATTTDVIPEIASAIIRDRAGPQRPESVAIPALRFAPAGMTRCREAALVAARALLRHRGYGCRVEPGNDTPGLRGRCLKHCCHPRVCPGDPYALRPYFLQTVALVHGGGKRPWCQVRGRDKCTAVPPPRTSSRKSRQRLSGIAEDSSRRSSLRSRLFALLRPG